MNQAIDQTTAAAIRLILSDVDGVMTTGQLWFDADGNEIKQFHVRDGLAIKRWLARGGDFGIVSARQSVAVVRRANELSVPHVLQGVDPKLPAVQRLLDQLQIPPTAVAYIGDDMPDLPVMHYVGLSVAPADACDDVLHQADWVLPTCGGCGAVRQMIEQLLKTTGRWEDLATP